MKNLEPVLAGTGSVWQDLTHDFLEMACFLRPDEQNLLIRELQKQTIRAESIDVYPCFAVNGRVVIVCEDADAEECWLYLVKKQRIQKWTEARGMENS